MKLRLPNPVSRSRGLSKSKHPKLFDWDFYLERNRDIRENRINPWRHFCAYGHRENRNPHPLFNTAYYRKKHLNDAMDINPLLHYLSNPGELLDTHPLFDASFYVSQLSESPNRRTVLEYFMRANQRDHKSPSPFFSSRHYLEQYDDVRASGINPLYHFLRYGLRENRIPFFDRDHIELIRFRKQSELELLPDGLDTNIRFVYETMMLDDQAPTIICVSHEASLTGAPLIILKIAEQLKHEYGFNIVNLLFRNGKIKNRFDALGPTFCFNGCHPGEHAPTYHSHMNMVRNAVARKNPLSILMNSAESRLILGELSELEVPIISLIHENARCYDPESFHSIAKYSDKVIFPSQYVSDAAFENTNFGPSQTEIIPQGLLRDELIDIEPYPETSDIRQDAGIPDDGVLVLGCGTGDGRKGLDLFIATAISALNRDPDKKLYFGWLGNVEQFHLGDHTYWAHKDIECTGYADRILLFKSTSEVAPYFQACDLFFLTSRIDPFPCVVNEAMAVEKPVVLFQDGSGCVDLVTNDGGRIVPYGDVAAAAEAIRELAQDPLARRRCGRRNRELIVREYRYDQYVEKLCHRMVECTQQAKYASLRPPTWETLRHSVAGPRQERKRVIFCTIDWMVSGVNTFIETLVGELNQRGFDASILFTTRYTAGLDEDCLPKVPYQYLATQDLAPAERRERITDYLKSIQPCVYLPNFDYIASSVTPQLPSKVGVLGILHSDEDEHYLHGYRMGPYWHQMVGVSERIRQRLLDMNPAFDDKFEKISYGVPVPEYDSRAVQAARDNTDRLRLVYTGRLVQKQKRIFDFVDLARQLEQREIPFELTFIGDGVDQSEFVRRIAPHVERGNVRLLGRRTPEEITQELLSHHGLLLMSDFEGLPLSLLEAMACECIPIVTQVESGISEILRHRDNAMMSPLRNPAAMADNLVELYRDQALRKKLAKRAKQSLFDNELSAPQMADRYAELLHKIFDQLGQTAVNNVPLNCPWVGNMLNAA